MALLRALYPDTPMPGLVEQLGRTKERIWAKAADLGLHRSPAYLASEHACRLRRGDGAGAATRFKPGLTPWNKGTHFVAGGRAVETRFKPGNVSKRWDAERYQVGALSISTDGYIVIKLADGHWDQFHRWLWKEEHGAYPPKGMVLVFKDRDPLNCGLDNLELITRGQLVLRSTWERYPKALLSLMKLATRVKRKLNEHQDNQ